MAASILSISIQKLHKGWRCRQKIADKATNKQFEITDYSWEDRRAELTELAQDERVHADYVVSFLDLSSAKDITPAPLTHKGEVYVHPEFGDVPYPGGRCQ